MARERKARQAGWEATQGEPQLPADIDHQQWMRRRKRNTTIGLFLAVVAIVISLGYSLHNAVGRIDSSVAGALGPTTSDVPATPLGSFRPIGTVLAQGHKREVLMIGAANCDACAAERWALVKALGRFGTWRNLAISESSKGIPTFDLSHANYSSWYVAFDQRDIRGPLETLTPRDRTVFTTYDPRGTVPLLIVGTYAQIGPGVAPRLLLHRKFRSVESSLITNESTDFTRAINAQANLITAMLCKADGGNPEVFCRRAVINRVAARLP